MSRVGEEETAAGGRNASYVLVVQGSWVEPSESERDIKWVCDCWQAMRAHASGGVYVNIMTADEGEERVLETYGPKKYQRLVTLKNKYDPCNQFRSNQNIKPSVNT